MTEVLLYAQWKRFGVVDAQKHASREEACGLPDTAKFKNSGAYRREISLNQKHSDDFVLEEHGPSKNYFMTIM